MNNIEDMPVKCQNCPYWELAEAPYICTNCTDTQTHVDQEP